MVNEKKCIGACSSEEGMVEGKLAHLNEDYSGQFKKILNEYNDVIANSLGDVIPSKVNVGQKFSIFQKQGRVLPAYNKIIRNEVARMFEASIIMPV